MASKGILYLLPTVLSEGRTETIPAQARQVIASLDYFLVESVRTSRRYISALETGVRIEELQFEVVDKNTSREEIQRLLNPVEKGRPAGVLSEAGCPGVADPGARLAAEAHRKGIKVVPVTGPSSILLALMASGMNGQKFAFHGYLPIDKKERSKALKALEAESARQGQTQIFIETPYRNEQMLKAITDSCAGGTQLCVARDITGEQEWIRTATIKEWKSIKVSLHKVPAVFVLFSGPNF